MKCIKNRKRLLKPIKKKYRDTLILTGILILFFGVGITALVLLRRSSQLDMTSAYSVKEEMYGTHGAEISTQKADSFASSYAVSSGNMSLEGVAISDTTKAGLFDLDHGSVMFAQNIHEKSYPASITKIMTAILAFKHGNMDDIVTIPAEALNQESGSTEIGFQEGDQVTLDELLHGLLIYSGNDAAVAIAQHIGGSVDQFVEMMNQEALELGATNTHFANPSGLQDENHYTTPYDMAMILKAAMDNDLCREVLGTRTYTTSKSKPHPDGITVSNWFLRRIEDKDTHSEIIGAKTGFVNQSGSCAASMAQTPDGKEYICVTAGSTSSWRCIYDHVDIYDAFLPETAQPSESEQVTQ